MTEREIASVLDSRYIPRAGKYIVRLSFHGEKAEEVWMTGRQLVRLERLFSSTPHGHSTDRLNVIGVWNDKGYYVYSKLEKTRFVPPPQYRLDDLRDET